MHPLVEDVKTLVLDTLFPISCLGCGKPDVFLCDDCTSTLTRIKHQRCIMCDKPSPHGVTHPNCQSPLAPDGLICLYNYHDEKVSTAIITGKYKFIPTLFSILGKEMAKFIESENLIHFFSNFTTIPLPLYKSRIRWRGFNQSQILAEAVANQLHIPTQTTLTRAKATKTQKDLKREARLKNVENAFILSTKQKPPWYRQFISTNNVPVVNTDNIRDKNLLLIDDVVTTGATLREATKVLKRNGAKSVWCFALARD